MAALTDQVNSVLSDLAGLYGQGQPAEAAIGQLTAALHHDLSNQNGSTAQGYGNTRAMQTAILDSQTHRESVVHSAVTDSGNGTLAGRSNLMNQIADLQARFQAIAHIGDLRFSGPALLDSAHTALNNATRQVNADVATAQQHAAQIVPPVVPQPRYRAVSSVTTRVRRRRRIHAVAGVRTRRRIRVPSDATAGGRAVQVANAWLGTPYVWGGGGAGGPSGGGFDCSGLTQYAIAQASGGHVLLPRTTYEQIYSGQRIDPREVQPGDLVFPASSFSSRGPEHVQLAAGNGMVVEAPYTGSTVRYSAMSPNAVVVRVL